MQACGNHREPTRMRTAVAHTSKLREQGTRCVLLHARGCCTQTFMTKADVFGLLCTSCMTCEAVVCEIRRLAMHHAASLQHCTCTRTASCTVLMYCLSALQVCKQYSAFRLLGMGMGVWCCATAACGLAPNFGWLLTARAFVGVGEASFVALAAPFIGGCSASNTVTLD